VTCLDRELGSKNPRSFEQVIQRISRDVPGLKNDTHDFVSRMGEFVLKHFASRIALSPLLVELQEKVDALQKNQQQQQQQQQQQHPKQHRENDRECNKGNVWAASVLGLPAPPAAKKKSTATNKSESTASSTTNNNNNNSNNNNNNNNSSTKAANTKYPMEDMLVPGATEETQQHFKPLLGVRLPQSQLLNVFMACEFIASFGDVIGFVGDEEDNDGNVDDDDEHSAKISPSVYEDWMVSTTMTPSLERLICELLSFVATEALDPAQRGFGATVDDVIEEEDDDVNIDTTSNDYTHTHNLQMGVRLKRLVPLINTHTWEEVLRRIMFTFRAEVNGDVFTQVQMIVVIVVLLYCCFLLCF
jgi:hypothetical protein